MININDIFWTLQGEGINWGKRSLFVRMPFCNLKCEWCDTEFNSYKKFTDEEFINIATEETARFAVITGGEPMLNIHTPKVIKILKELGFLIACETNGTAAILDGVDFVTVSPKKDSDYSIHKDIFWKANELKVVVDDGFDLSILENMRTEVNDTCRLSLSPEFNNMEKSVDKIIGYIKENPQWQLSLQTHKWINIK